MKSKRIHSSKDKAPSLVRAILTDFLIRHWLLTFLAFVVIASAMLRAKTSHEIRSAVALSQQLREERQKKEISWQEFRLEMSGLSEADRISRLAKKQLNMIEVTTKSEKIITL